MKNEPTISVIVPVYNGEQYINDCLENLFKQTLHDAKYGKWLINKSEIVIEGKKLKGVFNVRK